MRVLIFESDHGGHRLTMVRNMLAGLLPLTNEITVATNRAAPQSAEFVAQLAPLASQIRVDTELEPFSGSPLAHARYKLRSFAQTIRRLQPDHVYVPYADGLTQLLAIGKCFGRQAIPRDVESEGLLLRGGFAYPAASWRGAAQSRASRHLIGMAPWSVVHWLDPIPMELVIRRGGKLAERSRLMPDPVESPADLDRVAARRRLGIPVDGRYVSCVGTLDGRKGIDLLIQAFAAANLAANDRLLLLGRLEERIKPLLERDFAHLVRSGRIILFNRYVSDQDLTDGVVAGDLICTPYPRHIGSASIVIRASAAGRPVLGSDFGWIASVTERLKLGWTCHVTDLQIFAAALKSAMENASSFQLSEAGRRFVEFHSMPNFTACWAARLRERLHFPVVPALRTWQWVVDAA